MFEKVGAGWDVAKATRKLVFEDKRLFLYPIVSALTGFVLAVVIFLSVFLTVPISAGYIIGLVLFYIATGFTSTYIMMAMLIAFRSFTQGKRISMSQAFGLTRPYSVLILEWSLFYTIIIMALRAIESRLGLVGRLVIGAVAGLAISAATVFVVPVILDNKVGPIKAVEISAKTLIKHFGSTFGGIIYSDLYSMIYTLGGIGLIVLATVLVAATNSPIPLVLFIIGVPLFIVGLLLSYTLVNAYKLILYDYVQTGKLPQGFTKDMINASIRQKGNLQL